MIIVGESISLTKAYPLLICPSFTVAEKVCKHFKSICPEKIFSILIGDFSKADIPLYEDYTWD